MRKRSEIRSPSAAERTLPIPGAGLERVTCSACGESFEPAPGATMCQECGAGIDKLAVAPKPNGLFCIECLEPQFASLGGETCKNGHGGAAGLSESMRDLHLRRQAEKKSSDRSDDPKPKAEKPPNPPLHAWCAECAAEISAVDGIGTFVPCGHAAGTVDDPRKAKKVNPPAGLQTRTKHEVDRRNREDAKSSDRSDDKPTPKNDALNASPPAPKVTVDGDRLSVEWGKSTFPLGMMSNFTVGGFFASAQLSPGVNKVAEAERMLAELRQIADAAFEQQFRWYTEKLARVKKWTEEH